MSNYTPEIIKDLIDLTLLRIFSEQNNEYIINYVDNKLDIPTIEQEIIQDLNLVIPTLIQDALETFKTNLESEILQQLNTDISTELATIESRLDSSMQSYVNGQISSLSTQISLDIASAESNANTYTDTQIQALRDELLFENINYISQDNKALKTFDNKIFIASDQEP